MLTKEAKEQSQTHQLTEMNSQSAVNVKAKTVGNNNKGNRNYSNANTMSQNTAEQIENDYGTPQITRERQKNQDVGLNQKLMRSQKNNLKNNILDSIKKASSKINSQDDNESDLVRLPMLSPTSASKDVQKSPLQMLQPVLKDKLNRFSVKSVATKQFNEDASIADQFSKRTSLDGPGIKITRVANKQKGVTTFRNLT